MIRRLERKHEPLATRRTFMGRVVKYFLLTNIVVAGALSFGTLGYHFLGQLGWLDALYNSAMIMTGMGPVDRMESTAGKLFGTFYALFSGIIFLTLVAVLIAPIYHRFLHHFHHESQRNDAHSLGAKSRAS
jgi:hypothetical protein